MKAVRATVPTLASLQVVPPTFVPAPYRSGSLPVQPPQVVAGGQVLLEVKVGNDGKVLQAVSLRSTPPFTELLLEGVRLWRFEPAEYQGEDVGAAVLPAGLFRPPTLMGPTAGEPPQDIGTATDAIPVPYSIVPPDFPPGALADAVVLVEALVERDGTVKQAHAARSVPGSPGVAREL